MTNNVLLVGGFIVAVAIGAGGYHLYDSATSTDVMSSTSLSPVMANDNSEVVVTVNGKEITQNMIADRKAFIASRTGALFAQLPPVEQERVVRENLILETLVDQNMKGSDIASDPMVAEQLRTSRNQILRTAYLDSVADGAITDESLRANYDAQIAKLPDLTEVRARHILVKDKGVAADLIDQINNGASFEKLAATNSLDKGNAAQGGDLGYFTKDQMVPEFAKVVFAMDEGALTQDPVKTGFGYHVIMVVDKRVKPKPTFEQVREGLVGEERQKVIKQIVEKWRAEAEIVDKTAVAEPVVEDVPVEAKPLEAGDGAMMDGDFSTPEKEPMDGEADPAAEPAPTAPTAQ